MQLSERHGRALQQYNKLTRKMEPLTADIKSRMEKNSKVTVWREGVGQILSECVNGVLVGGISDEWWYSRIVQ